MYEYDKYKHLYNTDEELKHIAKGKDTIITKFRSIINRCTSEKNNDEFKLFQKTIPKLQWKYLSTDHSNHLENSFKIIDVEIYNGDWAVPYEDKFFDNYFKISRRIKMSDEDFISSYYEAICGTVKCWIEFCKNPIVIQREIIKNDGTIGFINTKDIYNKNVDTFNDMLNMVRKLISLEKKYCINLDVCRDYLFFKEIEDGLELKKVL